MIYLGGNSLNKFTKMDRIIIISVILLAIMSYLLFTIFLFSKRPKTLEIFVDGKLYGSYNLAEINTEKVVEINTEFGYNVLKITPDGAEMREASCPDKRDLKSGKITRSGQMIICVPNRVSVKLTGDKNPVVDKVSY